MTVAGLALDASNRSPIVLLRDPSGRRQIPIWIDHAQAHNIVSGIQNPTSNSPLTHDLIVSVLNIGGINLDRVIIHALEDNDFQAVLRLSLKNSDNENSKKNLLPILKFQHDQAMP